MLCSSFLVFGFIAWIAEIFSGSILIPSADTICPRDFVSFEKNAHFFRESVKLNFRKVSKTNRRWDKCWLKLLLYTRTSSMYNNKKSYRTFWKMVCRVFWKMIGETFSPWGRTLYSCNPKGDWKAVYCFTCSARGSWWNPERRSMLEKKVEPLRNCRVSWIVGMGKNCRPTCLLSCR